MRSNRAILVSLLVTAVEACAGQEIGRASAQTVKVYKNTGAVQCGTAGVPAEVMEKTLTMNGIDVLSYFCGHDGYLRPAVCGAGTGSINVYEIGTKFLQKALDLGFGETSKLPQYRKTPCRDS
jgi:transcription elongation factor Elf1